MLAQDYLIQKLSDGEFHSGVELGEGLQISRTAVWKNLEKLRELGLEVERTKGKGYRIPGGVNLLQKGRILGFLKPEVSSRLQQIEVFTALESTNQWMLQQVREQPGSHCRVSLAEYQTAGRGRRGRQWVSPFGLNLCMSFGYTFREGFSALEGLSLAVGVMVAEALAAQDVSGLQLKWPNDIWAKQKKLGGVLIEVSGEQGGPCDVVIGLGLNVLMLRDNAPDAAIDQSWTSIAEETGRAVDRNEVSSAIINSVISGLVTFEREGFSCYRERWSKLNALRDQSVKVSGAQEVEGICRGIGRFGHLLLETAEGIVEVAAGEVSLRRL